MKSSSSTRLLAAVLLASTLLARPAEVRATPTNVWEGVQLGQVIAGPQITREDVKGRVIFLEYWGINCGPCLASFPHLIELQSKYGPTRKFTILASHVQLDAKAAANFCEQKNVNFPVFHQLRLNAAPVGGGIPSAYLIDPNGQILAQGHPAQLYAKVAEAVAAAPEPVGASPLRGTVDVRYLHDYARELEPGKPVYRALARLQKIAEEGQEPAAAEARALIAAANQYLDEQIAAAEQAIDTRPSLAYSTLVEVLRTAVRLPQHEKATALINPLRKDPSIRLIADLRTDLDALLLEAEDPKNKRRVDIKTRTMQARIDGIARRTDLSEACRTELEGLKEKVAALQKE